MKYICQVCEYVYDEEAEGVPFADLPDDWTCPLCGVPKSEFAPVEEWDSGCVSGAARDRESEKRRALANAR